MANPVFSNSAIFGDPRDRRNRPGAGSATQTVPATQAATLDAATLEQMYGAPAATTAQTGRLTYDDVIMKTGGLLAVLVVFAAITWYLTPTLPWLWIGGMIAGLVLGLVNAFRREPSPALITAYVVAEGVFLGGISLLFQNMTFDGQSVQPIVAQAIIATIATFAAALFLFKSGKVRVTPKFTRWLIIAMVGYLAFSLVNLVMSFFVASEGFGPLRNGWIGVAVGLFAVGLAAASLIVDFDGIKRGVEQGVPRKFAWTAAFGLIVTLVWLYLEFLRIFAILSGRE